MNIIDLNTDFNFCIVLHRYRALFGSRLDFWKRLYDKPAAWITEHTSDVILEDIQEFDRGGVRYNFIRVRFFTYDAAETFSSMFGDYFDRLSILFHEDVSSFVSIAKIVDYRRDISDLRLAVDGVFERFPVKVSMTGSTDNSTLETLSQEILFAYDADNVGRASAFYVATDSDAVELRIRIG